MTSSRYKKWKGKIALIDDVNVLGPPKATVKSNSLFFLQNLIKDYMKASYALSSSLCGFVVSTNEHKKFVLIKLNFSFTELSRQLLQKPFFEIPLRALIALMTAGIS